MYSVYSDYRHTNTHTQCEFICPKSVYDGGTQLEGRNRLFSDFKFFSAYIMILYPKITPANLSISYYAPQLAQRITNRCRLQ